MAASTTLKATEYTKTAQIVAGTASAETFSDASKQRLHAMYDEYSAAVAYDAGSEIAFAYLPKGARILGWSVAWDAQGAAVTGDFEIGGVTASTSECVTDMTSTGGIGFIPALAVFQDTPLTANSVLTMVTAAQPTGIDDKIMVTTFFLNED